MLGGSGRSGEGQGPHHRRACQRHPGLPDGWDAGRADHRPDHEEYGIAAFESHRLTCVHNTERGDGGEAGIYIGDTGNAGARVAHNTSTGWAFGFFFRDSRAGTAWGNRLTRNCIGALILDTGPNGRLPSGDVNHPAGAWRLAGNSIVGADHVGVLHNTIRGNNRPAEGASGLGSAGGRIVDGSELVGSDVPEQVLVVGNRFRNDLDFSWDRSGTGIRFRGNRCRTSDPVGLCGYGTTPGNT